MTVYFIRHGQSQFNAAYDGGADPMIFDAPLTPLGFAQAAAAREQVAQLGITRVITSPLTRAIQTAKTIFDGIAPLHVNHGHHEWLQFSGDVGRAPAALAQDFPDLSFAHLPDPWWYDAGPTAEGVTPEPIPLFQARIAQFVTQINAHTEDPIAVVGHGNAFQEIIGFMLENCEVHQYR